MQTNNSIKVLEDNDYQHLNSTELHRIRNHDRNSGKSRRRRPERPSRKYPEPVRVY